MTRNPQEKFSGATFSEARDMASIKDIGNCLDGGDTDETESIEVVSLTKYLMINISSPRVNDEPHAGELFWIESGRDMNSWSVM
jgi:hypothetical protein